MHCMFKGFFSMKVCTTYSRTSYRIVLLKNLNKYLRNVTSETEEKVNNKLNYTSTQSDTTISYM